jgi:hypothetical protein
MFDFLSAFYKPIVQGVQQHGDGPDVEAKRLGDAVHRLPASRTRQQGVVRERMGHLLSNFCVLFAAIDVGGHGFYSKMA